MTNDEAKGELKPLHVRVCDAEVGEEGRREGKAQGHEEAEEGKEMTERPILFSAPMVCAILDGQKTQTRRIIKPPAFSTGEADDMELGDDGWLYAISRRSGCLSRLPHTYQIGMRLWVRETWGWASRIVAPPSPNNPEYLRYAADCAQSGKTWGWRPSIHMPRWASRITLEVTAVKFERLQDISAADCRLEGHPVEWDRSPDPTVHDNAARDWFQDLWTDIHGPGAWAANPWVAAITFRRVT